MIKSNFQWIFGFSFSLGLGWVITGLFLSIHEKYILNKFSDKSIPKELSGYDFPGVVGIIERSFFTFAAAFYMNGTVIAMIAWIGLKIANTWPWPKENNTETSKLDKIRRLSFASLLAGLVSMAFALIGGLICREKIVTSYEARCTWMIITVLSVIFYACYLCIKRILKKKKE